MQEEILSLKLRISEQEEVLKGTIQRLRSTSRTKESMEHFIVNQCKCVCAPECAKEDRENMRETQGPVFTATACQCGTLCGIVVFE